MQSHQNVAIALALGLALAGAPGTSRADAVEDFYRGKQVNIIVGLSVGGGHDLYARLLARHYNRHIPGKPSIIVQNMPGAGTLKAVLYLHSVAPQDGTYMATFARTMPIAPLLSKAEFDGRKLGYVGSIAAETGVCVTWRTSVAKNWNDFLSKDFTLGGLGQGGDPDLFAALIKTEFGSRHRLVAGYPGNADLMLAMERGEIDGICGLSYSTLQRAHPDWVQKGAINIVVQSGLTPSPALPGVPSLLDLATQDVQRQVTKLAVAPQAIARPFATAPNVPPARLAALRAAFDATMKDPDFLADATRMNLEIEPMSGAEMDRLVAELYATPRNIIERAVTSLGAN